MITTNDALDDVLRRSGDDLFRLAVLLAPDASQASGTLLRAVRPLAAAPAPRFDEIHLIEALLAALPRERPRARTVPAWARPANGNDTPLLAGIAHLPMPQRLALGVTSLRAFEGLFATEDTEDTENASASAEVADRSTSRETSSASVLSVSAVAEERRAALVALAPFVLPQGETLPPLLGEAVPETCRPARAALVRGDDVHDDPAIRGHLALCAECRAAAHSWREVSRRVEEVVRGALRPLEPPPGFVMQLHAAATPQPQRRRRRLSGPTTRRLLVPLAVLLVIAGLVWPRATPQGSVPAESIAIAPSALVERALQQLYAPPAVADGAVWQSNYTMRWYFSDESYADLEGTLWTDSARGRHRVQLVHAAGGGPFELELGDGRETLWYFAEPRYAASIYPQIADRFSTKVELGLARDEQQTMLAARLGSGAWALPAAYLRQAAAAADLRSWGRRTAEDGAELAVISFRGQSVLGQPAGAASNVDVTVLLAVDITSGQLYEVRELVGPDAGEQTGRTVWRFRGGEWLTRGQEIEAAFEPRQALRSPGGYALLPQGAAAPELPTVPIDATLPLVQGLAPAGSLVLAPADAPPGTTKAALVSAAGRNIYGGTLLYLGDGGRRFAIRMLQDYAGNGNLVPMTPETEAMSFGDAGALADATARVRPGPTQRYDVWLEGNSPDTGLRYQALINTQGYSRDELLALLPTVGPLSPEAVRRQTELFVGKQYEDQAAFKALLDAVADVPLPPEGQVRYTLERTFARQAPAIDPLGDPYHLPPYAGWPETTLTETWVRAVPDGAEFFRMVRGEDGTVLHRNYIGPTAGWSHDVARGEVMINEFPWFYAARGFDSGTRLAEQLLQCGAVMTNTESGERIVVRSEPGWLKGSCAMPSYTQLVEWQAAGLFQRSDGGVLFSFSSGTYGADVAPYLLDLPGYELNLQAALGENQRIVRTETRVAQASPSLSPTTVERWELVREEIMPAAQLPAGLFEAEPPTAIYRVGFGGGGADPSVSFGDIDRAQARAELGGVAFDFAAESVDDLDLQVELENVRLSLFDPNQIYAGFYSSDDPFTDAFTYGAALRFDYDLSGEANSLGSSLSIYQGRADRFGEFLRARARWRESQPFTLTLEGRELQGWMVNTFGGRQWLLVETDGVLLAIPSYAALFEELMQRLVKI